MESKTLGFSISIYFMLVRCLLVKQSLTGSDINTSVRPEMFWRCPIWQVIAKLSSPGSWSTSWQVSQAPQPLGLETPAGVLARLLPTCWKVEILGAWTPLWFPCLEALSGPAGAPELLPSLTWSGGFGQPSRGGPQHHGCAGARGAGSSLSCWVELASTDLLLLPETMSSISRKLGNLGIVFWCFWSDLSGNFQFVGTFKRVCFLLDLDPSHQFIENLISCRLKAWLAGQLFCSCPICSAVVMNWVSLP